MITFPYHQYHPMISEVVDGMYSAYPELARFGDNGRKKCREDNEHHFHHLETAYQLDNEKVFVDYAIWLNGILVRHGMKTEHLIDNFNRIVTATTNQLPIEKEHKFHSYLHAAIIHLQNASK
ncbi:hypothetical protein [Bacillus alkalicellulosilyticus]|uniref:hypothetical protein n=1 Tax=Alkalihalobacterium alkalicellulosilyticum TaxID=1912214 RepID=UPI00099819EC|nr:hypothetical protein [Bacillus alkalicellulosilyticus]